MPGEDSTRKAVDEIQQWRSDPRDMHLPTGPQAFQIDPMYLFPIVATSLLPIIRTQLRHHPYRDAIFMGTIFFTMGFGWTMVVRHKKYDDHWWRFGAKGDTTASE